MQDLVSRDCNKLYSVNLYLYINRNPVMYCKICSLNTNLMVQCINIVIKHWNNKFYLENRLHHEYQFGWIVKIFCFHQLILVYHPDKHVIPTWYSANWYVHTLQLQKRERERESLIKRACNKVCSILSHYYYRNHSHFA